MILPVTSKDMPICPLNERFNSVSSRIKLVVIVICYQLAHANIKFKPAWWDGWWLCDWRLLTPSLSSHISNPTSTPCLTTTILRLLNRNIPAIALLIRNCLCCSTAYQCKIRARCMRMLTSCYFLDCCTWAQFTQVHGKSETSTPESRQILPAQNQWVNRSSQFSGISIRYIQKYTKLSILVFLCLENAMVLTSSFMSDLIFHLQKNEGPYLIRTFHSKLTSYVFYSSSRHKIYKIAQSEPWMRWNQPRVNQT